MTREEKDTELLTLIKESRGILGELTRAAKRSNEIEKASDEHARDMMPMRVDKISYIMGAKWANEHPNSPWISVKDDLPCNHKELISETPKIIHSKELLATKNVLVVLDYNTVKLVSMVYINNKWEWDSIFKDEIVFWMPVPELPKE